VIWKRLFNKSSNAEKGTLYQLKNLLHRTAVPSDPGDNMKAAEDFLEVVLHAHIVAAAESLCDTPGGIAELSEAIVDNFVKIALPVPDSSKSSSTSTRPPSSGRERSKDQVFLYATEVVTLGLLWMNFHDATREGDGDRLIRVWKFLLLVFKAARRKNYGIEALNLQLQVNYTLSPRQAAQLKWSRCINTTNQVGKNVPMDLHLEHLNRRLKGTMRNMGANVTDNSITMAAQCLRIVDAVCTKFEESTSDCAKGSQKHGAPSSERDHALILQCLKEKQVCTLQGTRQHKSFKFSTNILKQCNYKKLVAWMKSKIPELV